MSLPERVLTSHYHTCAVLYYHRYDKETRRHKGQWCHRLCWRHCCQNKRVNFIRLCLRWVFSNVVSCLLIRRWKETELRASSQNHENALPASLSDDASKMVDEEGVVSVKFHDNCKYSFLIIEICYKTYFML